MPFYTVKIIVYSTHLPHKDVWPLTVFPTPPWVQFITESSFSSVLQTFTILCPDAPILCLHGLSSSVFRSLATVWSLRDHCSKSFQDVKLTETRSESLWGQDDFCNAEILLAFFFFLLFSITLTHEIELSRSNMVYVVATDYIKSKYENSPNFY